MHDIVLVYQRADCCWFWERIDPEFNQLFYADVEFSTAMDARLDAESHNAQPYRLEIVALRDEESW